MLTLLQCVVLLLVCLPLRAAENRPTGPAAPASATLESLAMLQQVVSQVADCVRRRDLASVHLEDVMLNSSMAAVLELSRTLPPAAQEGFRKDLTDFAHEIGELHYVSDLKKQAEAEKQLLLVLQRLGRVKAWFPEPTVRAAIAAAERYLCPLHPEVTGRRTELCPKCGRELEQQVRLIAGRTNGPYCSVQTIRATIRTAEPLVAGQEARAVLTLQRLDGSPVYPVDLIEMHTQKIHLLLVDSSLADYQHAHPVPTPRAGEYEFSFTPHKPGSYLAWADVRPAPLGLQEYAATTIRAETRPEPMVEHVLSGTSAAEGLVFQLTFDSPQVRVGKPATGRLRITRADGSAMDQLEPFMEAFAHLVGFHENRKDILHLHPKGRPVRNASARGGPELEFVLYATQPGFVRLFAQVQVDGALKLGAFGVEVVP